MSRLLDLISARTLERGTTALAVLAAVMFFVALFTNPYFGWDAVFHYSWLRAVPSAMFAGDFYLRWLNDAYAGLGSPTFYFYPPLTYWLAAPFHALLPAESQGQMIRFVGAAASVGAFFSFRYTASTFGYKGRWVNIAAVLYAIAPFRLFGLLRHAGVSSHMAQVFLPLAVGGLASVLEGKRREAAIVLTLGWCAMILTNVPNSVLVACLLVVTFFVHRPIPWNKLALSVGCVIAGTLLAAFYWLPMLNVREYVQLDHLRQSEQNLVAVVDAVVGLVTNDNLTESMHIVVLFITAMCVAISTYPHWRSSAAYRLIFISAVAGTLILFEPLSYYLWELPLVSTFLQFPHRYSIAILFAAGLAVAFGDGVTPPRLLAPVLLILTCLYSLVIIVDFRVNPNSTPRTPFDPPEYAPRYASHDMNRVIEHAKRHANDPEVQSARTLTTGEELSYKPVDPERSLVTAKLKSDAHVTFQQWYWPYWQLRGPDGAQIPMQPDSIGRATAVLPAGVNVFTFELIETNAEKNGVLISIATAILMIVGVVIGRRKNKKPDSVSQA